jgi:hypothetical protein
VHPEEQSLNGRHGSFGRRVRGRESLLTRLADQADVQLGRAVTIIVEASPSRVLPRFGELARPRALGRLSRLSRRLPLGHRLLLSLDESAGLIPPYALPSLQDKQLKRVEPARKGRGIMTNDALRAVAQRAVALMDIAAAAKATA